MNPIRDIVIVGGGTAGLVTAIMIKSKLPFLNVRVVKSSKTGIIGVGEGSTPEWSDFQDLANIDFKETIKKTDATVKIGILFKDWNYKGHEYVHAVPTISEFNGNKIFDYLTLYPKHKFPLSFYFYKTYYQNKIPIINRNFDVTRQFHFDTFKLNNFLLEKCKEKEILVEDYFIKDIKLNDKGEINSLLTDNNQDIKGDFFIDCSGFKRILISKLGAKWISYRDKLPVSHAITFPTSLNLDKGIEPYTTATSLSSGWSWKIPTQTRYGNGYVFDDRYISKDNALNELNQHLGTNVEKVAKSIPFEAGKINKFWIKNCVAIGLAGSFLEPLEAQSIGFSIKQAKLLIDNLIPFSHSPDLVRKEIEKKYNYIFDNTLNMVQLHYLTKRNDSKFWKEKPFNLTTWNKENLKLFSMGIINHLDKKDLLFNDINFYQILHGLDIINKKSIQNKYELYPETMEDLKFAESLFFENIKKEMYGIDLSPDKKIRGEGILKINHYDYLNILKENFSS